MSVTVKSINGDTTLLLTFQPPTAPPASSPSSPRLFPGSFSILLDPWLEGPTHNLSPKFSTVKHGASFRPWIKSLAELPDEPDLVIVSLDKPDHCNEATLKALRPDTKSTFLGIPASVRKIKSWNHFKPEIIQECPTFDKDRPGSTVRRFSLPPLSPRGQAGEATVSFLKPSLNLSRLKIAIGITYRPPVNVLSPALRSQKSVNVSLLPTPAVSPTSRSTPSLISSTSGREKTVSVLYSPHGVPAELVREWASAHLVKESVLPLTVLIHSLDFIDNPKILGGNISTGAVGGFQLAEILTPTCWIGTHDAEKDVSGFATRFMRTTKYGIDEVREWAKKKGIEIAGEAVLDGTAIEDHSLRLATDSHASSNRLKKMEMLSLKAGEEKRIALA